jgi:hypothetical protein
MLREQGTDDWDDHGGVGRVLFSLALYHSGVSPGSNTAVTSLSSGLTRKRNALRYGQGKKKNLYMFSAAGNTDEK